MFSREDRGLNTRLLHGKSGVSRDLNSILHSHSMPIVQTSTFSFDSIKQAQGVFSETDQRHEAYTRLSNPNHRKLEESLCVLEDGEAAQVFDSGMTATKVLLESLTEQGDHIIAHRNLYGGTYNLFKKWRKFGVSVSFVDARDVDNVLLGVYPYTTKIKMIFLESPSNPSLDICDFKTIKEKLIRMDRSDTLVVVDNTFATPCNQQPLKHGADIVVHSLTKYINGYGTHIGGAIITFSHIMKRIWDGWGASGGMMDPSVAWGISNNLISLPDRMKRHNENGKIVAEHLLRHPKVEKVNYPGFRNHPNYKVAIKLMTGFGGMVSFELKGDQETTQRFLDKLAIDSRNGDGVVTLAVSLGTVDSLIICPALTTHFSVPREERLEQGISDNLIRMSVGTENIQDILDSLERGFSVI